MLRSGEQRSAKARFSRTVTSERWSNRFTHGLGDSAGVGRFERRARADSVEVFNSVTELSSPRSPFLRSRSLVLGLVDSKTLIRRESCRTSRAGVLSPNKMNRTP